jgi:hypothetical protein
MQKARRTTLFIELGNGPVHSRSTFFTDLDFRFCISRTYFLTFGGMLFILLGDILAASFVLLQD